MSELPKDVRERMYFAITMPLNKDGHGPAADGEITKITWEVWDQFLVSYGSFDFLPDAIQKAEELNFAYHVEGKKEAHQ